MSDIQIVVRRDRAYITGRSELGNRFIVQEMEWKSNYHAEPSVVINAEFVSDIVEEFKKAGLTVETI